MKHRLTITIASALLLLGCSASSIDTEDAKLGVQASWQQMLTVIDQPGPIRFEKHTVANWQVPLSGLLNLDHPQAIAAGLADRQEAIKLFVYVLQHPAHGTFLVDSGVSTGFSGPDGNPDIGWAVEQVMKTSAMDVLLTSKALAAKSDEIAGVFLTHIHLDHIMGLTDFNSAVPVYTGPDEAGSKSAMHLFSQGTTDRLLSGSGKLLELQFGDSGLLDVFGDGSLWAIHSPGHTPGTTAFLARTTAGTQLMIGDVTHTRWGWDNGVEPGNYSMDGVLNAASLAKLRDLVSAHPGITVHPGHQD